MASVISLSLSFAAHAALIHWLGSTWPFWTAIGEIRPMEGWAVGANIVTALIFGLTGAGFSALCPATQKNGSLHLVNVSIFSPQSWQPGTATGQS
jgi:hypothetical protein